jgi:hypothetical protein
MAVFTASLVGVVALSAPRAARAESRDPLASVRESIRSFEYEEAIEQARAISADPSAPAARRLEALALSGAVHLLQRQQDEARRVFERVLTFDPGYRLTDPDLPPRVLAFFEEVRQAAEPASPVTLAVDAPAEGSVPGGDVRVSATLAGPTDGVDRVVLNVREGGEADYEQVELEGTGAEYSTDLPTPAARRGYEIYVEVIAASGTVLASEGSEEQPIFVEPLVGATTEPARPPEDPGRHGGRWYTSWWFWTIVGVAVAGSTLAAVLATTLPEEHRDGSLGSVQMPIEATGYWLQATGSSPDPWSP